MNNFSFDFKRVHLLNLVVTLVLVLLINIPLILARGIAADTISFIVTGVIIVAVALTNYFLKIHDLVKGFIFAFLPALVALSLFILNGFALNKHYILLITIMMAAAYFNRRLLITFGAVLLLSITALYITIPASFLGIAEQATVASKSIIASIQKDNATIHQISVAADQISLLSGELHQLAVRE